MAKASSAKKKKIKKKPTPLQIEQRKQKSSVRSFFRRIGFDRVPIDGFEFKFMNRTGELDDLFLHENVIVLCEYTTSQSITEHVTKKKLIFDLIMNNPADWVKFFKEENSKFSDAYEVRAFLENEYRVRILYISSLAVSEEIETACSSVIFLSGAHLRYFESLSKTIYRSARFELFKYLQLDFKEIGELIKSTATASKEFDGHVLPENFSSFPSDFKIVSFYADPETLLRMSYVLRRDGWMDREGLYQRILSRGKIRNMRRYLTTDKRVFVNNIVVTLPNDSKLNDPSDKNKNLDPKALTKVESIVLSIPDRPDTIGIVDGQHRIYCYHEGSDSYDGGIAKIRKRQNLLVTGIIFPGTYTDVAKRRFEAKLFLEINDTQARTKSDLKQSIELVLNPYSVTAIAKAVIQRLSEKGPLKGLLQTNFFDPPELIKTSSIVSYGLRPLVKLDGNDSLFSLWKNVDKTNLKMPGEQGAEALLQEYVAFCADKINELLIAVKLSCGPDRWTLDKSVKKSILRPTSINGFVVCLRYLIQHGKVKATVGYQSKLTGLASFKFESYKSSQWRAMGEKLYAQYF